MLKAVNIYKFKSFQDFVIAIKEDSIASQKPLSYGQIAQKLGTKSPRLISMIAKGQRSPSQNILDGFTKWLKLNSNELRYLELLAKRDKLIQKDEQTKEVSKELKKLIPEKYETKILTKSELIKFSKWYYYVIKQFVASNRFNHSLEEIQHIFRGKIKREKVITAINDFVTFGFLKKEENKISLLKDITYKSEDDIPSASIRRHHTDMLKRAIESLDEQDTLKREFQSITFRMAPEKLPEAKKELREFIKKFNSKYTLNNQDDLHVYQLNLNLFEHTNWE